MYVLFDYHRIYIYLCLININTLWYLYGIHVFIRVTYETDMHIENVESVYSYIHSINPTLRTQVTDLRLHNVQLVNECPRQSFRTRDLAFTVCKIKCHA